MLSNNQNLFEAKKRENMWDIRKCDRKFIIEFIELYASLPSLWDVRCADYNNRSIKSDNYEKLINKFKEVDPEATRELVTKKINSLRTNFRKDLKGFREAVKAGNATNYVPKTWYFNHMMFLQNLDIIQKPEIDTAGEGSVDEGDSVSFDVKWDSVRDDSNENPETKIPTNDVCQILINMANESNRREGDIVSNHVTESRIIQKAENIPWKQSSNDLSLPSNVHRYETKGNEVNHVHGEIENNPGSHLEKLEDKLLQKNCKERISRIYPRKVVNGNPVSSTEEPIVHAKHAVKQNTTRERKIYAARHEKNKRVRSNLNVMLLQTLGRLNKLDDNDFDMTGNYYSYKLSKMSQIQRIYADRLIHEVLMEGLLGNLRKDSSVRLEPDPVICKHNTAFDAYENESK